MDTQTGKIKAKSPRTGFRQLLQDELVKRCQANGGYSLRAFARALNVEPSALSQIINGKRPITDKMRLRLGSALGLSVSQISQIPSDASKTHGAELKMQQLTLDSFAVISDWYHYAILELTYLDNFQPNSQWIARSLGISKSEANVAVERLFRLGLLHADENGTWKDTSENGELTQITPGQSSVAARKYQSQLLDLSKRAIQNVSPELRNHTSATFCFDAKDLKAASERIADFRRAFAREFQPAQPNKVYQIQISFFPLTVIEKTGDRP